MVKREITPAAAIYNGRLLPSSSDLFLDENTPPPLSNSTTIIKITKLAISIPKSNIDKSLYLKFLSKDARQTVIQNNSNGKENGVIFQW